MFRLDAAAAPVPMSIHAYRDHVFQKAQSHEDTFVDIKAMYKTEKYIPEPRGRRDSKRNVISMRKSFAFSMRESLAFSMQPGLLGFRSRVIVI